MEEEYEALMRNQTWKLVPKSPPNTAPTIGCKWVFRIKKHPNETIQKYKARLIAKGFHQKEGVNFNQVFSPIVQPSTVKIMLSLALTKGWKIRQFDFNNDFLIGDLAEDVFMSQPEGFLSPTQPYHVCKLQRSLYGLKQALHAWFTKLKQTLNKFGFSNTRSDTSLFTRFTMKSVVYILVYVDDILVTRNCQDEISTLISQLNSTFSLKDLGEMNYFLGIETVKKMIVK
ncbi:Retrovirus-related Pol polyprotein [Arachis hypogaea]|nr:Retrovirus-related Pol polyprotein [Arachis hypogaea]